MKVQSPCADARPTADEGQRGQSVSLVGEDLGRRDDEGATRPGSSHLLDHMAPSRSDSTIANRIFGLFASPITVSSREALDT